MSFNDSMFKSKRSMVSEAPVEGHTDDDSGVRRSVMRSDVTKDESPGTPTGPGASSVRSEKQAEKAVEAEAADVADLASKRSADMGERKGSQSSVKSKASSHKAGSAVVVSREPSFQGSAGGGGSQAGSPADEAAERMSHHSGLVRQGSARSNRSAADGGPTNANADLQIENQKLKAQIESLQRLYASGTQDAKVHRIQEEVTQKAKRIKDLEEKVRSLEAEAKKLKEDSKKKARKTMEPMDSPALHDSKSSSLNKQVQSKNERITELEYELKKANDAIAELRAAAAQMQPLSMQQMQQQHPALMQSHVTSHSDGPPPAKVQQYNKRSSMAYSSPHYSLQSGAFASPPSQLTEVQRLRETVQERDTVIHELEARLSKAQEAILSSAGVGWEAHVKLHQTKGMLEKFLRSTSPQRGASQSMSPQQGRPQQRMGSEMPTSPAGRTFTGVEVKAAEDEEGNLRLWRMTGFPTVITSMRYTSGVIYDQNNQTIKTSTEAYANEIPRLAALADICGVPHNLPQTPVVVIAGHAVAPPISSPQQVRNCSPIRRA